MSFVCTHHLAHSRCSISICEMNEWLSLVHYMGLVNGFTAPLELPKNLPVSQTNLDIFLPPQLCGVRAGKMEGQD